MKLLNNVRIEEIEAIRRDKAKYEFDKGNEVLIKLSDSKWVAINNREDEFDFDYGVKFYIANPMDDSKLIITRHELLARYIREELGINAKQVPYSRINEVIGKDVYGIIPLHFLPYVNSFTYCRMDTMDESILYDDLSYEEFKTKVVEIQRYTGTQLEVTKKNGGPANERYMY